MNGKLTYRLILKHYSLLASFPTTKLLNALKYRLPTSACTSVYISKCFFRTIPHSFIKYAGVIGRAGIDFPAFPNIPNTGFNCKNVPTGYYADLETDCQVYNFL